jgi:hypothetical protein
MIQDIIKEYEQVRQRESELSFQLSEHYQPIINRLSKKKDRSGLEKLLDEIPDSIVKMGVYQALRELKN